MVLCRHHRHDRDAIRKRQQRRLFTNQTLFQHHLVAGIAMDLLQHDFVNGCQRFDRGFRHDHAFARRQAIRLDYNAGSLFLNIGLGFRR